jgi:hypothetical protein
MVMQGSPGRSPVIRRAGGAVAATLLTLTAAACGSDPAPYQFVANNDRTMVVKLPGSWRALDPEAVDGPSTSKSIWSAYFDASKAPSADHAQVGAPADTLTAPVARMQTIKLREGAAETLTDDVLRDILLPASEKGVQRLQIQAQINVDPDVKFGALGEEKINTQTGQGLRLAYGYDFGNGMTIREKIVLVDPNRTHLHAIEISCSPQCFKANRDEIERVLNSFTVKPLG